MLYFSKKKHLKISLFYTCILKLLMIWSTYSSWDIECDRLKLVIMGHFLLSFFPLKTKKIRIFKKWKKLLEISSFCACAPKSTIIWGTGPEITSKTDRIVSHFGQVSPFTPLKTSHPRNSKLKNMRKFLEISSFYTCVPTIMIRWCMVPEIWCATDG